MVRSVATRAVGRGLGAFEPTGGTLVAYSAKGGTVASDGSGRNSPFMEGLLANIEEPGIDVSLMFRKVRDSVLRATGNVQEPFVYGSLPGEELYLVPAVAVADAPAVPGSSPVAAPAKGSEQEEFAWSLVKESGDADKLQQYLFAYPEGVHVTEAILSSRHCAMRRWRWSMSPGPRPWWCPRRLVPTWWPPSRANWRAPDARRARRTASGATEAGARWSPSRAERA
jgi:hypothetical protein